MAAGTSYAVSFETPEEKENHRRMLGSLVRRQEEDMWLIRVTYGVWQKCGVDEAATRSRRSVPGEVALGDSLETSSDGFRILT